MSYNLKPSYSGVDELQTRDRGVSVLYGRTPDALGGEIIPIKVDAAGSLVFGTSVSLSGEFTALSKGIFDPTFVDPQPEAGASIVGLMPANSVAAVSSSLYALLAQDPRFTFTSGALNVAASGTNSTIFATQNISVVAPTYTSFSSSGITPANVRGFASKSFVAKNTGANPCQVRAFVSMDSGTTYDVPILSASVLAAGSSVWIDDERAFTNFQFQIQRDPSGDTTVQLKGYTQ